MCLGLAVLLVVDLTSGNLEGPLAADLAALAVLAALPLVRRRYPLGATVAWAGITVRHGAVLDSPGRAHRPLRGSLHLPHHRGGAASTGSARCSRCPRCGSR